MLFSTYIIIYYILRVSTNTPKKYSRIQILSYMCLLRNGISPRYFCKTFKKVFRNKDTSKSTCFSRTVVGGEGAVRGVRKLWWLYSYPYAGLFTSPYLKLSHLFSYKIPNGARKRKTVLTPVKHWGPPTACNGLKGLHDWSFPPHHSPPSQHSLS